MVDISVNSFYGTSYNSSLILGDKVINLFKGIGCFSGNISAYSLD